MTAAELIRSARMRAALAQHELADMLGMPRTQIGRWESGEVEPAFATVRRVLRACGFDLSMALLPYAADAPPMTRLVELSRLTPKERLDQALTRGNARGRAYRFDPYAILGALEERGVDYILIGSLARLLQGADELPESVDVVFPKGAFESTDDAVRSFARWAPGHLDPDGGSFVYLHHAGRITTREVPKGTASHRELRRRAERVHLGGGLRPRVASPGDLVTMMEALARPEQGEALEAMRRVVELDRGLRPER